MSSRCWSLAHVRIASSKRTTESGVNRSYCGVCSCLCTSFWEYNPALMLIPWNKLIPEKLFSVWSVRPAFILTWMCFLQHGLFGINRKWLTTSAECTPETQTSLTECRRPPCALWLAGEGEGEVQKHRSNELLADVDKLLTENKTKQDFRAWTQ